MITLTYAPGDNALAQKIRADLQKAGFTVSDTVQPERENLLIAVLSPDIPASVNEAIIAALEAHQHVIPVYAKSTRLPRLIDNLQPLDFSKDYPIEALIERARDLSRPDAPRPLTTLTPSVREKNRRAGLVLFGLAFAVFLTAIITLAVGLVAFPEEEYDAVATEAMQTIEAIIVPTLSGIEPRTTQDAIELQSTVQALPTALRQPFAATATAIAVEAATP